MTMIYERIKTEGIAQLSYLIGDDEARTAAVIDPRPDVRIYLDLARRYGVRITHVFETHIHADFMSGTRSLVARLGDALPCASVEGDASYDFDVHGVRDGDRFEFGAVRLEARHTPGHTPEHLSYLVAEADRPDDPWAVFSGDSLFVGSAGRPDLLGDKQTEELASALFRTLRDFYLKLDDGVIVLPGHGAGSACGADIGDRPLSTIGVERRTNDFLQYTDEERFTAFVIDGAPPEPHHYRRLKKTNAAGPPALAAPPPIPALTVEEFAQQVQRGAARLVDVRHMLAFGGGHIEGAVNIGAQPELSVWAGQMLDVEQPILLVLENERDLDRVLWLFVNTGFTSFAGYLAGGMQAWEDSGRPMARLPQMPVDELHDKLSEIQVVDVRSPDEWEEGHIPGAKHLFVADLRNGKASLNGLRKDEPLAVYCGSGYRADIAASLLRARGFRDVRNVPGSWNAWQRSGYEIER